MRLRVRQAIGEDRGAAAVLVAASLFLLMGFAAIAVDSGIGFGDRRQQQSAADVGALAAVQFARTTLPHPACSGLTGEELAACRGAVEALDVIEGTLPGRYEQTDWDACTDPNRPADYIRLSAISKCISFTDNMQRARVVLPGTEVGTQFGRVLGFDFMSVGAFAEAGLEMDIIGGVFPFAVGPSGAGSNQACFMAQSTGNLGIEPCGGPAEGNFGKLNLRLYGNENYGTPEICSGQNAQRIATNIVTGTDHPFVKVENPPPNPIVHDNTNCAIMTNPVNTIDTWTGNAAGALRDGLFNGISQPALPGRLMCKNGTEGYPLGEYVSTACEEINNQHPGEVDHTPLWEHIRSGTPGLTDTGSVCAKGKLNNRADMEGCLDAWKSLPADPNRPSLFTEDLATSTRFGAVPILDDDPGSGKSAYHITEFLPVYISTVYLKCGANKCDTVHSPGEDSAGACPDPMTGVDSSCGWPGNGQKSVDAVTAFILTLDMLPEDIADNFPWQDGTIVYNLFR